MTSIGIRELKNNLSRIVKRVEAGERVIVTDRGRAVAELVPARPTEKAAPWLSRYATLVSEGVIRPPLTRGSPVKNWPDIHLPPGTAARLIDEDRDEG